MAKLKFNIIKKVYQNRLRISVGALISEISVCSVCARTSEQSSFTAMLVSLVAERRKEES